MYKRDLLSSEYKVDTEGVVYSKRGTPLKPSINQKGYCIVNLVINGKRKGVAVHTLVARAFVEGYLPELQVNHKDGVKTNNKASNLEWITGLDNVKHSREVLGYDNSRGANGNATPICAIEIDGSNRYEFDSIMSVAEFFEPNADYDRLRKIQSSIWRVLKGYRKSYHGYYFEYL